MAKLYFNYSTMNAGKSTMLLQAAHNYSERGMQSYLLTARLDTRAGEGRIASRIGIGAQADLYDPQTDLFAVVQARLAQGPVDCLFLDEAQFLTAEQVWQLARVVDDLGLPAMCYGLRVDFQGNLFPGSAALLGIADKLVELKGVCHCGRKATMNLRVDASGAAVREGAQTEIGGNDRYVALCRKHFSEALAGSGGHPI